MQTTPAQQRLVAAAQQRRAMEYEKELAAWRAENGLAPIGGSHRDDGQPLQRRQLLGLVVLSIVLCLATLGTAWLFTMIGGAL